MSKVIYKYEIDTIVVMPKGAEILSVQIQHGKPHMWALVDNKEQLEERQFNIIGTGWEMDFTNNKYIDTFQDGNLVWHVFEEVEGEYDAAYRDYVIRFKQYWGNKGYDVPSIETFIERNINK
jgi:hypothetical protein